MKNDQIYYLGEKKLKIKTRYALNSHLLNALLSLLLCPQIVLTGKILKEKLSVNGILTFFNIIQKFSFIERMLVFFKNVSDKRVLISKRSV